VSVPGRLFLYRKSQKTIVHYKIYYSTTWRSYSLYRTILIFVLLLEPYTGTATKDNVGGRLFPIPRKRPPDRLQGAMLHVP